MLTIDIVLLIWLTTITGTIMMAAWYGIGLILERLGFINIIFELLKMVVLFFYLPIAFMGLKIYTARAGVGQLFSPTPPIISLCQFFLIAWGIGVVIGIGVVFYNFILLLLSNKSLFDCEQELNNLFKHLKTELHLEHSRIELRHSYQNTIPYVEGLPTPRVVLPIANFTSDELRVILVHELMHYKQKDLFLKLVTHLLLVLHFFNPFAWKLFAKIQKWSEFACDYRASKYIGDIKTYFDVIINISMENPLNSGLTSQAVKDKHELYERVQKLKRNSEMKKKSVYSVILVLCAAFMLSSTTVYAATMECANAYMKVEERTAVADEVAGVVEAVAKMDVVESVATVDARDIVADTNTTYNGLTMEYGDDHRLICLEGEIEETTRGGSLFEWDLPIGSRIYGPYFQGETDMEVGVTAFFDPLYVTIRVGLEDERGYRYYGESTDSLYFTFTLPNDRKYRIYAENNTHTAASVSGSYITRVTE